MRYLESKTHTVKPYQKLYDILRIYALPVYALVELNPNVDIFALSKGDKLKVLDFATSQAKNTYTMQENESVNDIADKFRVDLMELYRANPNLYPKDYTAGQTVIIP